MAKPKPIPDGYRRVTPYLIISGASDAIDYYTKTFGMKERMRMAGPDGKVGHAELELGDSVVMLADEFPDMGIKSPKTLGGTPAFNHIYVEDVDGHYARAQAEAHIVGDGGSFLLVLELDNRQHRPEYFFLGDAANLRNSVARVMQRWDPSMPLYGRLCGMLRCHASLSPHAYYWTRSRYPPSEGHP